MINCVAVIVRGLAVVHQGKGCRLFCYLGVRMNVPSSIDWEEVLKSAFCEELYASDGFLKAVRLGIQDSYTWLENLVYISTCIANGTENDILSSKHSPNDKLAKMYYEDVSNEMDEHAISHGS